MSTNNQRKAVHGITVKAEERDGVAALSIERSPSTHEGWVIHTRNLGLQNVEVQ